MEGKEVKEYLQMIDQQMEEIAQNCVNTTIVVTADHGHITQEHVEFDQRLKDMCVYWNVGSSGTGRFPYFNVKKDMEEQFKTLFLDLYGKEWILLNLEEAKEVELFNPTNTLAPEVQERIGTFVGVAYSDKKCLCNDVNDEKNHIGGHGTITANEMEIPFVVVNNP